jgi:hypothetical protein
MKNPLSYTKSYSLPITLKRSKKDETINPLIEYIHFQLRDTPEKPIDWNDVIGIIKAMPAVTLLEVIASVVKDKDTKELILGTIQLLKEKPNETNNTQC